VRLDAAPINPADINVIEGTYGKEPALPAIAGLEGVGTVLSVGSQVKGLAENDRVIPAGPGFGTWRTHAVTSENNLLKISSDIPIHQAASISVNPSTALRLLEDFVSLKEGDVVIQNGANSMVGFCVAQLAKLRGVRTINIIRERSDYAEISTELRAVGGDIVVSDKYLRTPQFKRLISDLPKPKLALNCVGGESATEIARHLGDNGVLVTYGGMSKQPIQLPTSLFIFRNVQARGFWLTKWVADHSAQERKQMIDKIADTILQKKLRLYIEGHKLSEFDLALKRYYEPYRGRKIVLELGH